MRYSHDFIVIGSGIAGLTFALKISEFGNVALIAKDALEEGATRYAQGGIASVMAEDDSMDLHVSDTLSKVSAAQAGDTPGNDRPAISFDSRAAEILGLIGGLNQQRALAEGAVWAYYIDTAFWQDHLRAVNVLNTEAQRLAAQKSAADKAQGDQGQPAEGT